MSPDETPEEWATRMFETGGGFGFADQVADGFDKRIVETCSAAGLGSGGVMTNSMELSWLVDAYRRLRIEREVTTALTAKIAAAGVFIAGGDERVWLAVNDHTHIGPLTEAEHILLGGAPDLDPDGEPST